MTDPNNRDRIFYWLANKLRDTKITDASAQDLIQRGQDVLQQQVISEHQFRDFLLHYYSPPTPPEPGTGGGMVGKVVQDPWPPEITGDVASFVMRLPEPAANTAEWERTNSVAVTSSLPNTDTTKHKP